MNRPSLGDLVDSLCAVFPELDHEQRRLALATYRRLARGIPASPVEIAEDAGIETEKAQRILADWIGVYSDEAKRVIGFWGLTIAKMVHRFEVDGTQLYTWCAWDTLFLPELLGKSARVESVCEASGKPVRLTVSPKRVESVDPASVCISFLTPDSSRSQQDIVRNFCHYVHFFRSRKDCEAWIARRPGTFILSLDEATELARRKNQLQFGPLLSGKPEITLVYDADCPNVPQARAALREAFERAGLQPRWIEYDRAAPGTPAPLLRYGSPTILVDGVDVAGEAGRAAGVSCRVYPSERGLRGVPPVETIASAMVQRKAR
jgi:alkylmercury lyase